MSLSIKKGDNVLVIAGKDKGKTGKVLVSLPADNSVVVAGVNIIAKHKKPRSAQDKGGIIKKEGKIHASNVQIVCPTCNKATRISNVTVDGKKIRQCKKCGANLDVAVKKEVKKTTTKETTKTTTKSTATKTTTKSTVAKTTKTTAEKKPATKSASAEAKTNEAKTTTKSTASKTTKPASTTAKKSTSTKKVEK